MGRSFHGAVNIWDSRADPLAAACAWASQPAADNYELATYKQMIRQTDKKDGHHHCIQPPLLWRW